MTNLEKEIKQYAPLIHCVIKNHNIIVPRGLEYSDLVSIGTISIWQALEKWDEEKNPNKATYLYREILYRMIDEIRRITGYRKTNLINFVKLDDRYNTITLNDNQEKEDEYLTVRILSNSITKKSKIIIDYAIQGYRNVDIAKMINKTDSRISQMRKKAIQELKNLL